MRILVCGGRDYRDAEAVFAALDRAHIKHGISCIIAGAASGADHLAAAWAKERAVDLIEFPSGWNALLDIGAPLRNRQMLAKGKPDAVIAFPGGRGTADMIRAATAAGLKVWQPIASAPAAAE